MAAGVESWDEDADFQGDLFTHSVSTVQTSFSSRLSIHSESNAGEEDWQVQFTPNDDLSTNHAIQSAKQAGVPIPTNVPSSALVGGTIKRLGKKDSRQKLNDDWGDDLDFPSGGLTLKPTKKDPIEPASIEEERDDFDDWTEGEGSLGIRFAGSRRETRNRSSSASAMSPSLGSQTAESEEDDFRGLELPEGPVDLQALLKKRQASEAARLPESDSIIEQPKARTNVKSPLLEENDDFFDDLEVGGSDVFDPKKLTLHKNVKQKPSRAALPALIRAPTTTLTFTDKPAATRIPRPVSGNKPPSRLEPLFESGATQELRQRPHLTTTGAQLLRSKRSMPLLRNNYQSAPKPNMHFLPAGPSAAPPRHLAPKPPAYHLRRDSDPNRSQSPPPRSFSRLSSAYVPDTPSRTSRRPDLAPRELAREAAAKKTLTRPQRKRNFGDGTELEIFDDLPTSVTKEMKFMKQPSTRVAPKSLRNIPSRLNIREDAVNSKLPLPDRMATPLPGGPMTPRSPMKVFQEPSNTPRYLRDTAASRIARETRLGPSSRPRSEGPLMPVSTNWKAQVAARSPHASPTAQRTKGKRVQPGLIKPGDAPVSKTEKGMVYNPATHRWEGNENTLGVFDFPPPLPTPTPLSHNQAQGQTIPYLSHHNRQPQLPPSPPRPALIAPMSAGSTQNIQVVGGMVFDPVRMCWLKFKSNEHPSHPLNPRSPSVTENDDDEDPFAGIEDLKDGFAGAADGGKGGAAAGATKGAGAATDEWLVGEEFDLGPEFIRRQKEEEIAWRRKCEAWFGSEGEARLESDSWRWTIREIAGAQM